MLNFRKATYEDKESLRQILNDAINFKLSKNDEAWGSDQWTDKEINAVIELGNTYLVSMDNKDIGCVDLIWEDKYNWGDELGTDNSAGYLHRLAILTQYKCQGLDSKVIEWISSQVKANKRQFIRLDCHKSNKPLCHYYERLGFELVNTKNPKNTHAAYYQKAI